MRSIALTLLFFLIASKVCSAQSVSNFNLQKLDVLKEDGFTVVYWSEKKSTQARIKKAFEQHFNFSPVKFITADQKDNKFRDKNHFYLVPAETKDQNAVTHLVLSEGDGFFFKRKKEYVATDKSMVMITLTQPFSKDGTHHALVELTEAYVIMMNDVLHKSYSVALRKPVFFATAKNAVRLHRALTNYKQLKGKTLLIPSKYASLLPKRLWDEYYKQPYAFIKMDDIPKLIEERDSNTVIFIGYQVVVRNSNFNSLYALFIDLETKEIICNYPLQWPETYMRILGKKINKEINQN